MWVGVGLLGSLLLLSGISGAAPASSGQSGYQLARQVIGSGPGSAGGGFILTGAYGQPLTGASGGGSYKLQSGFWPGLTIDYEIYLPLVSR